MIKNNRKHGQYVDTLKVNTLNIDLTYQRGEDPKRVSHLIESLEWKGIGAIIVSKREDGTYWIIDGQQRVAAVRAKTGNEGEVFAIVHEHLPITEEARLFTVLDDRKALVPLDLHKASITAKFEPSLDLEEAVKRAGLSVLRDRLAVRSLEVAQDRGNLTATLTVLSASWGKVYGRKAYGGEYVKAVSMFIEKHPNSNLGRLAKQLAAYSPTEFTQMRKAYAPLSAYGSTGIASYAALVDIFNIGLRKDSPIRVEALIKQ